MIKKHKLIKIGFLPGAGRFNDEVRLAESLVCPHLRRRLHG